MKIERLHLRLLAVVVFGVSNDIRLDILVHVYRIKLAHSLRDRLPSIAVGIGAASSIVDGRGSMKVLALELVT
jgi:hypothetical protein